MNPCRVLLADDHEIVLHGARSLLESAPGWTVCGEARTGREAVEMAAQLVPDIVVMDISMPELNGLEATRQILKSNPQIEILILSMHDSEQCVREVLGAGARGYVLKADAGRDLLTGVEALAQHRPFFTSRVAEMVLKGYLSSQAPAPQPAVGTGVLSARETEVVQLIAEGKSNKEIASQWGISIKTVETHRAHILNKLRLHSVTELVRYAFQNNLVQK